ncbi:MAG: WYL domain-containing protein [Bacilli bacterium]|nr:WYL domain-containing protein [Bacilli bacterium]
MAKPKSSYGRVLGALILIILLENSDESHPLLVSSVDEEKETIQKYLLEKGVVVNNRTVNLTLEELSEYELVKRKDSKKSGWYALRELDEDSIAILLLSMYGNINLTANQIKGIEESLTPLIGLPSSRNLNAIMPESTSWNRKIPSYFAVINQAIKRNKQISYTRAINTLDGRTTAPNKDEAKYHTINPLGITYVRGSFYLLYSKGGKNEVSFMRLDNIGDIKETNSIRLTPEHFDIKEFMKHRPYPFRGEIEKFEIVINDEDTRKDPLDDLGIIRQWFGNDYDVFKDPQDQKYHITIMTTSNCFRYWYVQYAENFQIVSPESMVESVKEYAEMILRKN